MGFNDTALSEKLAELGDQAKSAGGSGADLTERFDALEKFIHRRFDEISAEINATAQQVDFAEEGIVRRFGEIMGILTSISQYRDGTSPMNQGVELEAVVEITERAANRILDAAERIASRLQKGIESGEAGFENAEVESIHDDIQEILMACEFQDLTGQRIRMTIENLRKIEERLSTTLANLGVEVEAQNAQQETFEEVTYSGASQDDIDALFD